MPTLARRLARRHLPHRVRKAALVLAGQDLAGPPTAQQKAAAKEATAKRVAKAAVVNLTQALADEWAGSGIRVNCINPERTSTPMRTKAFGEEPAGTLLTSEAVARQSLDVLLSGQTGHVIDIRREDGPAAIANG